MLGVPVTVQPSWLFGVASPWTATDALLPTVVGIRRLSLGFLGGEAELDALPRGPRVEAAIAMAGPLSNGFIVLAPPSHTSCS